MADITTPVADGIAIGELIGGKLYGRNFINDPTGVDAVGVVGASPDANTLLGRLKAIADAVTTLGGNVDGLETLATALNGYVDTLESLIGTTNTSLTAISGYVDGLESAAAAQSAAIAMIGTRAYSAGQQVAIGATSAASTGLAATEVLLHASSRCFVRVATAATAGAGIPLEAGEKFHLRLASGQQIHVIRDTADGFLNVVPVA